MRRGLPGLSRPRRPPEKIGGKKRPPSRPDRPRTVSSFSSSGTPNSPRQDGNVVLGRRWPQTPAALGGVAGFAGFYLLLAAGTNLLPEKFRIKRYKFWMRTVLFVGG